MFESLKQVILKQPIRWIFSQPIGATETMKVEIHWIEDKKRFYQKVEHTKTQVFHQNFDETLLLEMLEPIAQSFRQANIFTKDEEIAIRVSKKGKVFVTQRKLDQVVKPMAHNREKSYVMPKTFHSKALVALGIMDDTGHVFPSKFDKYKQINRFLEMIEDVIEDNLTPPLRIVDFGCGKSYLTFIVYEYFTQIRKIPIEMIGLDLKEDVIDFCNATAQQFGYQHLHFVKGDIAQYNQGKPIDVMISLHACNTATDYALYQAMISKAKVILAVPCCHKELLHHGNFDKLPLIHPFGLSKERISALLTDNLRSALVSTQGYKVDMLEMFDLSHSPKNILLRALYTGKPSKHAQKSIEQFHEWFDVTLTLEKLLQGDV